MLGDQLFVDNVFGQQVKVVTGKIKQWRAERDGGDIGQFPALDQFRVHRMLGKAVALALGRFDGGLGGGLVQGVI